MQKVFIGDVQGCVDEFDELLGRIRLSHGEDFCLWLTGDVVNRGPENLKILERIQRLTEEGRARLVLGNHEIGLLRTAFGIYELRPMDTTSDILESSERESWLEWLRRRPLVESSEIGGQRALVVHAAVDPDWSFKDAKRLLGMVSERLATGTLDDAAEFLAGSPEEDPEVNLLERVTHCRSVNEKGAWSSQTPDVFGEPWHAAWLRRGHSYGVVYGHWARQGLHLAEGLRGLDTGCVHHARGGRDGFLTAWVPASDRVDPFGLPDDDFIQIPARRRYLPDLG